METGNNILALGGYFVQTKIYPNPTTGEVQIKFEEVKTTISLKIDNSQGQVMQSKDYKLVETIRLEMDYPPGIYYLNLKSESGGSRTLKILKD